MTSYLAGAAVRSIAPSPSMIAAGRIWLWGLGSRTDPCDGIRNDITVRAIALRDPAGHSIALVSADVGALDPATTRAVRDRLGRAYRKTHVIRPGGFNGLEPECVCINVSHTHSAPVAATIPTWQLGVGTADAEYARLLEDQLVGVVEDAFASLQAADITWARGTTAIGHDRHFVPERAWDPTLDVLRIADASDRTIAVAFSTACHPTCLDSNEIDPDFPGVARSIVEDALHGHALFLQGYAGICTPGSATVSDDVTLVGQALADDVLRILRGPMDTLDGPITARLTSVDLPFQPLDTSRLGSLKAWADANPGAPGDLGPLVSRWVQRMESFPVIPDSLPTELQAFRIGTPPDDCHIVASSHEVSTDFGDRIRALWPYPRVTTLGYSNAQLSYVPSSVVLTTPVDQRASFPLLNPDGRYNYEGGLSFAWYGHRGPITTAADDLFVDGHIALLDTGWSFIGDATEVVAMAAWNGSLFAATGNDRLWWRKPVAHNVPWTLIGDAQDVVGMAASNGLLFCATRGGSLWCRSVYGFGLPWKRIDSAENVTAMTALDGTLYAATSEDKLWQRDAIVQVAPWVHIGHAITVCGLAAAGGKLVAATTDSNLHWRDPVAVDAPWHRYGTAQEVVGMTAIDEMLFVATKEGKLWRRYL